jgi:hypothetical protein
MSDLTRRTRSRAPRRRFWVEVVVGGLSAALALLTLVTREWIELLVGVDPDGGDGSVEWLLVLGLAVVALVLGVLARGEWRRTVAA